MILPPLVFPGPRFPERLGCSIKIQKFEMFQIDPSSTFCPFRRVHKRFCEFSLTLILLLKGIAVFPDRGINGTARFLKREPLKSL